VLFTRAADLVRQLIEARQRAFIDAVIVHHDERVSEAELALMYGDQAAAERKARAHPDAFRLGKRRVRFSRTSARRTRCFPKADFRMPAVEKQNR
jgi:hypothetical protein